MIIYSRVIFMFGFLGQRLKIKKADNSFIEKYYKSDYIRAQMCALYEKGDGELYRIMILGKPVAQIMIFYNLDDKRFADGESSCYLSNIFVHPKFRRKGVATRLVNEMTDIAKSKGFSRIMLGVYTENENALRLYKKLGFTEECGTCDYDAVLKDKNGNIIKQKEYFLLAKSI